MPKYYSYSVSIGKIEEHSINEDAVLSKASVIGVSDGAGGGGLYADMWSDYLLKHLPNVPFEDYSKFDQWIEEIWEPFYNDREKDAKEKGGMILEKFYSEGSFATLAAIWTLDSNKCKWITYGDSVAFCYNPETHSLCHSFSELSDFNNPPYLINCKDELDERGYREGYFTLEENSILFVASDALAHYILLIDTLFHRNEPARQQELSRAITTPSKNSRFISSAEQIEDGKLSCSIELLLEHAKNKSNFKTLIECLLDQSLIAIDDYSLAVMTPKTDSHLQNKHRNIHAISKFNRILKRHTKRRR